MKNTLIFLVLALCTANSKAEVFQKISPTGHITLTNINPSKAVEKNPEKTLEQIATEAKRIEAPATKASRPENFPRISQETQKARDSDRKQILLDELENEKRVLALAESKKDVDNVNRHKKNIEALLREIANAR